MGLAVRTARGVWLNEGKILGGVQRIRRLKKQKVIQDGPGNQISAKIYFRKIHWNFHSSFHLKLEKTFPPHCKAMQFIFQHCWTNENSDWQNKSSENIPTPEKMALCDGAKEKAIITSSRKMGGRAWAEIKGRKSSVEGHHQSTHCGLGWNVWSL